MDEITQDDLAAYLQQPANEVLKAWKDCHTHAIYGKSSIF
jgi:hypothetical protein